MRCFGALLGLLISISYKNVSGFSPHKFIQRLNALEMFGFRLRKKIVPSICSGLLFLGGLVCVPDTSSALSYPIESNYYKKAVFNQPADDFWYPSFMIGRWDTKLKFEGATFTDKVPYATLSKNENLPGFSKYSIVSLPEMGKDVQTTLRYAQIDSHPREDHPQNIRHLIPAFVPDAVVDSAPYNFQKAPDWFHAPANHWSINYHDPTGHGKSDIYTRKRDIQVYAGAVETIEFIRQTNTWTPNDPQEGPTRTTVGEYALDWKLGVPASLRDEFVTVEDLRRTQTVQGTLEVLVYFNMDNDLYLKVPAQPAGVFKYSVDMERVGGLDGAKEEIAKCQYPFVWQRDGPVELDQYFGY